MKSGSQDGAWTVRPWEIDVMQGADLDKGAMRAVVMMRIVVEVRDLQNV